jgi:hypothetical protein
MAAHFLSKKDAVYAEIERSIYLNERTKKDMTKYLDGFFKELQDDRRLKSNFIDNARMD